MAEYGIWSDAAGGFIETRIHENIEDALLHWIEQGEDPEDLTVLRVCPEHEEQPADSCEECAADAD